MNKITCKKCGKSRLRYGFVSLSSGDGKAGEEMCPFCFCRQMAQSSETELPEPFDFEPISLEDGNAKMHTFHFIPSLFVGACVEAVEILESGDVGYRFSVLEPHGTSLVSVHMSLLEKVKRSISVKYLKATSWEQGGNRLYVRGSAINGRIEESSGEDFEHSSTVVVDGKEYTWEEMGRFLASYAGFNFRLEIYNKTDAMPLSHDPLNERDSLPVRIEKEQPADTEDYGVIQ